MDGVAPRVRRRRRGLPEAREARATAYRPIVAEALNGLGNTFTVSFTHEALGVDEEAVWTALAASRDDLAAEAAVLVAGSLRYYTTRIDDALYWEGAARALVDRLGEGHDKLRAWLLHDDAMRERAAHRPTEALTAIQQAVALKEKILPEKHPDIAVSLNMEAEILVSLGRIPEALRLNERVCEMFVAAYGAASTEVAIALSNRGEYLVDLGRPAEGLPFGRDALSMQAQVGADHPFVAFPLVVIGRALTALGRGAEAVAPLEHALRIREADGLDQRLIAEARFALARALWDAGVDHARAHRLATQARDAYANAKDTQDTAAIDAWLAAHPRAT